MPENTPPERKPVLGLSLSQLIGGSAAAATAAVLGSRLGVAGTILGAALVSVISAVAGALYTASLRRTQEVVIRTKELLPTGQWRLTTRTQSLPDVPDQPGGTEADVAEMTPSADGDPETETLVDAVDRATPSLWQRLTWKSIAITAAVVFVITAVVITGTELLTGKALDGSKGTTVSHAVDPGGQSRSRSTPTKHPTSSTTSKSTSSDTAAPTGVPSAVGSASPSDTPTPTPSTTPTPSETPSVTPSPTDGSSGTADSGPSESATP